MLKKILLVISVLALQSIICLSLKEFESIVLQNRTTIKQIIDEYIAPPFYLNESAILPNAAKVYRYDNSSEPVKEGVFFANLCRTSNCRASLDKWDCKNCVSTLPDGQVVRTFQTHPLGITGQIVLSKAKQAIYVVIRGASSIRTKVLFMDSVLIRHPLIPGVRVQRGVLRALMDIRDIVYNSLMDQLTLHPNFRIDVVGHSLGSAVGSLLTVDLVNRLPTSDSKNITGHLFGKPRIGDVRYARYVGINKINIRRYVDENDDIVHHPLLEEGFMHEGDEYWLKSRETFELYVCPGPMETRNCSSSLPMVLASEHLNYFGVFQGCEDNVFINI